MRGLRPHPPSLVGEPWKPEYNTIWDLVFPNARRLPNTVTPRPPRLLPGTTPLVDHCHHGGYCGDLDTRTPLPSAASNLVLIQNLPILIRHIIDASLTQVCHNPRQVTQLVAIPCNVGTSASIASTVAAECGLLFPIKPVGPRLAHPTTYSPGTTSPVLGCTTCPAILLMVEVAWSNGTPSMGTVR